MITLPTFKRLKDRKAVNKYYSNDDQKVVKFAYDDEGHNGFALLDMINCKIVSWSLSGEMQFKNFKEI